MTESYARDFARQIIQDKDLKVLFGGEITRMARGKYDDGRDAWIAVVGQGGGAYECIALWRQATYAGEDEDAWDLVDCAVGAG